MTVMRRSKIRRCLQTYYELFNEMYKIKVDETYLIKYKAVFSFVTSLFSFDLLVKDLPPRVKLLYKPKG